MDSGLATGRDAPQWPNPRLWTSVSCPAKATQKRGIP
jgi:hypothetical protein